MKRALIGYTNYCRLV